MKFTADQINYLCLTDLNPENYALFLKKLEHYPYHIINEKLCIIVTEDGPPKVLTILAKGLSQPDKINLMELKGSFLYGVESERAYGQERKTVFDKSS